MTIVFCGVLTLVSMRGETVDALLKEASAAARKGELKKALSLLDKAVQLDGKSADAYQLRGEVRFKLGKIAPSIADFDKFIALRPERKPWHWQRGICYYYAGRFKDGQEQFEAYQEVDGADVENVVWRYLCQAKIVGVEKAREEMLKVGEDRRVPMKEVYQMFLGKIKPEKVIATAGKPSAKQRTPPLFYAHLYVGLYCESLGDAKKAVEHLALAAAEEHAAGGYMWDVARVHRDIRRKEAKKKEK